MRTNNITTKTLLGTDLFILTKNGVPAVSLSLYLSIDILQLCFCDGSVVTVVFGLHSDGSEPSSAPQLKAFKYSA